MATAWAVGEALKVLSARGDVMLRIGGRIKGQHDRFGQRYIDERDGRDIWEVEVR